MRRTLLLPPLLAIACTYDPPDEEMTAQEQTEAGQPDRPAGSWETDPATGETRARINTEDGTTTLVAGSQVVAQLPRGFTLYPGARILNTINIGREEGRGVLLSMESDDPPASLVDYYRREAQAAGVEVDLDLTTGAMRMIGGQGGTIGNFAFQASREGGRTTGQLTVESGLN